MDLFMETEGQKSRSLGAGLGPRSHVRSVPYPIVPVPFMIHGCDEGSVREQVDRILTTMQISAFPPCVALGLVALCRPLLADLIARVVVG